MFAIRGPLSALGGAALSTAMFLGLWQRVSVPFDVQQVAEARRIDFTPQRRDTPIVNKRDPQVTREPPIAEPDAPTLSRGDGDDGVIVEYNAPRLTPPVERTGFRT